MRCKLPTQLRCAALLFLGLIATAVSADVAEQRPLRTIDVANAEDLAVIDERWVIASSMPGGELKAGALYLIDANSGDAKRAYPHAGGNARATVTGCDMEVAPAQFAPHGIALQRLNDGRLMLFVVNHGGRESIELFEVTGNAQPALAWRGCIPLPDGAFGNAVAVTPGFHVFVTNMRAASDDSPESRWMGNVLSWQQARGWQVVAGSETYAPNGLLASDDGATLHVASWAGGEVIQLTQTGEGLSRKKLPLTFLPDNLRHGRDGEIIATGLRATPEQVVHCMMAQGECDIALPTAIATVDAGTFKQKCLRHTALPMGTAAVPVGATLWVGPVRGNTMWVVDGGRESCLP